MSRIETNDHTSLYYRSWGAGKPVVFVSGYAWSGAMWEYQMISLSERGRRCIAYDRRGHGRSDDPGDGYDFDTLADDLAQLLVQLDLHEVTLVGQSMGCDVYPPSFPLYPHSGDTVKRYNSGKTNMRHLLSHFSFVVA